MKIGPLESQTVTATPTERKTAPAHVPGQPQASTQVDLSPEAAALSSAADATFDSAKVDHIAQAIRDGKFKVNPEAIADKLIANAGELLSRKTS